MPVQHVPDNINFSKEEEETLKLWKKIDAFKTSLKHSKNRPKYIFYDGPPFATGLPHYGHILAGTVKDIVTRWAHQSGFHVDRRFGWDCHGLPVEYEIDKKLKIKGPEDVAKMGIKAYNQECRSIVSRYATEWEQIVTRLGRWIDFKNDYKTMYPWFMESIWWIFKQLYDKGLIYRGFKVMPFSTACSTPLSNFETGQNYKDVTDPAVVVNFPLVSDPKVKILAWTTTPWTLPSNLSLCVHPDLDYVKLKDVQTNEIYIMMEARISSLYKTDVEYEILERFKGKTLEGLSYEPIFDYMLHMKEKGAFKVLNDTYVTEESGTGVVHQAPYFGEDDYRVNLKYNIITKDMEPLCPVDMCGRFTKPVVDFEGQHVKDADKNIMKNLKERKRLVHQGQCTHSYPFCWRSDTPLIYRAVPSWFVRVEHMQQKLLKSNQEAHWVPDFVKEKRFGNWLREARDWAISRNRYWGTPIPLWISDDGQEVVCISSIEELKRLSGRDDITDLHREYVDEITIPSKQGKGVLRRVPEVFDCWFESGSMPYAQAHYPFEHKKDFEDGFPGDFIAEGIDQTRGWFYTLLVLSTALWGKAPFKNLICHGLVLAKDGQKMSKRKMNYPDPMEIVNKYGADAIRLYLINSPVVRADNLRFKEEGVRDVLKDVFLPWYNAYRFLMQNIERLEREEGKPFIYKENSCKKPSNYKDQWIISFTQSLIKFVKQEMEAYRLYTVVPRLVKFVDQLTNWYVRMNRRRLKGEKGLEDCEEALESLFGVLYSMTKVMAPFIPFLTEHMYQNMKNCVDPSTVDAKDTSSVHFLMLPEPNPDLIDTQIENAVSNMQSVIEIGRVVRDRKTLPVKYPLREVVVIHNEKSVLDNVLSLKDYITEELNVKEVTVSQDKHKYGVCLKADPDFKVLGAKLKGALKKVMAAIKNLSDDQLSEFQSSGQIEVEGYTLGPEDLRLTYAAVSATDSESCYEAHSDGDILVLLDVVPDQSMLDEGLAREVINRMQRLRKKANLVPSDDITVYYQASGTLQGVCKDYEEYIQSALKQPLHTYPVPPTSNVIIEETTQVKENKLSVTLCRGHSSKDEASSHVPAIPSGPLPVCSYVNLVLCGSSPHMGATSRYSTVLLENPKGGSCLTLSQLKKQAQVLFGLQNVAIDVYKSSEKHEVVPENSQLSDLNGQTLFVYRTHSPPAPVVVNGPAPMVRYVNIELCGAQSKTATVLLENPNGDFKLSLTSLLKMVCTVFVLKGDVKLYTSKDRKNPVTADDTFSLHTQTLFAFV